MKKLLTCIFLMAAEAVCAAPQKAVAPMAPDLWASGFKTLAGLILVLGIILIFYALARKGLPFLPAHRASAIKVIETRPLGGKKGLCLVQVRGQEYLLGYGGDSVNLLSRLDQTPDFDATLQACQEEIE